MLRGFAPDFLYPCLAIRDSLSKERDSLSRKRDPFFYYNRNRYAIARVRRYRQGWGGTARPPGPRFIRKHEDNEPRRGGQAAPTFLVLESRSGYGTPNPHAKIERGTGEWQAKKGTAPRRPPVLHIHVDAGPTWPGASTSSRGPSSARTTSP